jgi:hypothetical protein
MPPTCPDCELVPGFEPGTYRLQVCNGSLGAYAESLLILP